MPAITSTIRIVNDPETREAIFRLRFDVLMSEMGLSCSDYARSEARLCDEADALGHLFAATTADGMLVGTARTNFLREGVPPPLDYFLQAIGNEAPPIDALAITSRMVVSSTHRNTPLAARLALAVYQYGLERGLCHDAVFVQKAIVPMYLRMGYRHYPC
jgi:GNAT superfamily N-acetyltransferase